MDAECEEPAEEDTLLTAHVRNLLHDLENETFYFTKWLDGRVIDTVKGHLGDDSDHYDYPSADGALEHSDWHKLDTLLCDFLNALMDMREKYDPA